MHISIPYYRGHLEADIDDRVINGIYESHLPAPGDEAACVRAALDSPIGESKAARTQAASSPGAGRCDS